MTHANGFATPSPCGRIAPHALHPVSSLTVIGLKGITMRTLERNNVCVTGNASATMVFAHGFGFGFGFAPNMWRHVAPH